jgi:hypothetical protein
MLPACETVILGAHHQSNLGVRVIEYAQWRTIRLQVLLEGYQEFYGRTERRLAALRVG